MTAFPVAGSEKFANKLLARDDELLAKISPALKVHGRNAAATDSVDPLTYEVVRHRLWAITEEMGDAVKRMSGSVVVTDANDFGVAVMDEFGNSVQVGLYNTALCASMDMAIKWTMEHRSGNPGIRAGDMFICNDPWVGGGIHQNDVSLFAPLFIEDELFAWTCAVAHQVDLGGVSPGSWSVHSEDVFWESLPIPPLKIVADGRILADVEDAYLRRSRMPALVALDLRAKVGANNVAQQQLTRLAEKYGAGVVKAVMRQMMDDAEFRLRARLRELPDGTWTGLAYQDQARQGDRGLYKITVEMTKRDDSLTFDFTGTDPQVDGLINCTYAGLRGGIVTVILTQLCGKIPWSTGGLMRCIRIISEPGTINNCTFPAGISKASVASGWATTNAVHECVASMLDAEETDDPSFTSVCKGSFGLSLLAGVDQYDRPFVTMLSDVMAGGFGARPDRDGVDTGGEVPIAAGRIADVEMNEFSYPVLYLWRREEPDTGGPGRFRGGVGGSSCMIPHDTTIKSIHLVSSASGKAVPQAVGISGGYPASAAHEVIVRGSNIRELMASRSMPSTLRAILGAHEVVPPALETDLDWDDVYFYEWSGGGGYGDPLRRQPSLVLSDVNNGKVSSRAANEVYGVVLTTETGVNDTETERRRDTLRKDRAGVAGASS
ncbi:hydantoinase B/oxoprolinase family protein [Amycolatopsis sp. H20-H5]|uniref:hydantoinase B/oxoprolinase family protein n=1 Tax=Amycolatopsis sp. H20-H5 TaxID=3046309 RepID=UPI002DBA0BC2|nr:hydantoinase B/oxoprolinase family protein [Amycolatopsis sp. H20-H5]MEC3974447.1 hydantoinase B/oxoprolinase family protein [Amycolatopsis sp. H20-H5]